jgi:hypothetical protein
MMDMYCIETFTANKKKSQKKVNVSVTLHGQSNLASEVLPLIPCSGSAKNIFNKGTVDTFYMVAASIPDLSMITVTCDGRKEDSWFLNHILIKVNGKTYRAMFNKWMGDREQQYLTLTDDKAVPYQGGLLHLGPILKFRGNFEDRYWRVSAMIVTENLPYLSGTLAFWKTLVDRSRAGSSSHESVVNYAYTPVLVYQQYTHQMWRFDFDVELNAHFEQVCYYKLPQDHRVYSFKIPALNQKPGILFCSCNDRAHPYRLTFGEHTHKCTGWMYMDQTISRPDTSYHLLIMGGDQIYADPLFAACESVRAWEHIQSKKEKWNNSAAYFTPKTTEELNVFYFKMYMFCWNLEAEQRVMSSVPSVMIYDDHDIYDGWGSLNPQINDSFMMMSIFQVAKKFFYLFQMQGDSSSVLNERIVENTDLESKVVPLPPVPSFGHPANLNDVGPFNVGLTLTGGVSVLMYDLRTERRMITHDIGIVMTENSYQNVERWLRSKYRNTQPQHLFAVLSVPIHYPDASVFNKLLDITNHNLIDDVRDHYSAVIHKKEQARVLQHLANFWVELLPWLSCVNFDR